MNVKKDEATVDSSPTTAALDVLTTEQRAAWRKTGELPAPPPSAEEKAASAETKAEGSSPSKAPTEAASAEEAAASSETAPESEPGTARKEQPRPVPASEKRIKELLAKNKKLADENEALKKSASPAAPAAAAAPPAAEKKEEKPKEAPRPDPKDPKYATETGYDDYIADLSTWTSAKATAEGIQQWQKAEEQKKHAATVAEQNKELEETWKARCTAAKAKHDDFVEVALDTDLPIYAGSVPDAFILNSELGAEVLYHLATHREELERINALPSTVDQARELFKIEASLQAASKPVAAAPSGKKKTDAPEPPAELGGRKTAATDAVVEALETGDFRGYAREANAREAKAKSAPGR